MIDWQALWVGDELWDKEHSRMVKFKSKKGSLVEVNYQEQLFISAVNQLRMPSEKELNAEKDTENIHDSENQKIKSQTKDPGKVIDLHLDQLPSYIQQAEPTRLLDLKINHCKKYITTARENHHKIITIIHGKGTGILKQEVLAMLNNMEKIRFVIPTQDGGATEVWFD